MNYRSKVLEINDFEKPDKKSMVRPALKACIGPERNIFLMPKLSCPRAMYVVIRN